MIIHLANSAATQALGKQLGEKLPAGSILLLEGDLGAGKTTLVQGIGTGLGIVQPIVSPTFTLVNEYMEGRSPLYHMDLYRLQPEDIFALDLPSYWEGQGVIPGIVAIEWASRLPEMPKNYWQIELTYEREEGRRAELTPVGEPLSELGQTQLDLSIFSNGGL